MPTHQCGYCPPWLPSHHPMNQPWPGETAKHLPKSTRKTVINLYGSRMVQKAMVLLLVCGDWNHGILYDLSYIGNVNHPNWRSHIFQRGVETANQYWVYHIHISKANSTPPPFYHFYGFCEASIHMDALWHWIINIIWVCLKTGYTHK